MKSKKNDVVYVFLIKVSMIIDWQLCHIEKDTSVFEMGKKGLLEAAV
jgi:hypothetical protein